MAVQSERDPKNSLRFYVTIPEGDIGPVTLNQVRLNISEAEKLLAGIKKRMANDGAKYLISRFAKLKGLLPPRTHGDSEPCHIKRAAAGAVPAHYRVGLRITFNNPTAAQAFSKALNIQ